MWRKKSIVDEALMFLATSGGFLQSTLIWSKKPIVEKALMFLRRLEDFLRIIKALLYEA
jgi:hypothetical protein